MERVLSLLERLHVRMLPEKAVPSMQHGPWRFGREWQVVRVVKLQTKVVLFLTRADDALLLEDDINLYPSDQLIVKLKTLDNP
jgi:hypothetical protein